MNITAHRAQQEPGDDPLGLAGSVRYMFSVRSINPLALLPFSNHAYQMAKH